MNRNKIIGILAFQGDVAEHRRIIEELGHQSIEVRTIADLDQIDALIIPGGESTTIGFFLENTGLGEEIKRRTTPRAASRNNLESGRGDQLMGGRANARMGELKGGRISPLPIWGTCAGAIILAKKIKSQIVPYHLGLMDMTVERNAYGRQIDSFYAALEIPALGIDYLKAAFIRAPIIIEVDGTKAADAIKSVPGHRFTSKKPQILATHEGKIVLVQQGNLLASTFHPELTGDTRLHQYFLGMV